MENDVETLPNWLFDSEDPASYFMPVNELRYTDALTVRRVYALARKIGDLFVRHGLFYWTTGGTTLGVVRHGGLIPWDDDLDICILEQDEPKLVQLQEVLREQGLCLLRSQPYAWKIFDEQDSDPIKNPNYYHRYPFCDVFMMVKQKGRFVLSEKSGRNAWPNEAYTQEQVDGVEARRFGNLELLCPGQPELYLDATYGPSWNRRGSTHFFNHQNGGTVRSQQFDIEPSMFLPARPFQ